VTDEQMQVVFDSFNNHAFGFGEDAGSSLSAGRYMQARGRSWDIFSIDAITRSDPFVRKMLEYRASEPLKNGIDLYSDGIPSNEIAEVLYELKKLSYPLHDIIYQGTSYGGSAGLIILKGQNNKTAYKKPLDLETITKEDFLGIKPLDRWFGVVPTGKLVKDPEIVGNNPKYLGEPEYFYVYFSGVDGERYEVHRSRLLLFNSGHLPFIEKRVEQFWGNSLIEVIWDVLQRYNNTVNAITEWLQIGATRVLKIDQFGDTEMANRQFRQKMVNKLKTISQTLSTKRFLILSKDDEFEYKAGSLAGAFELWNNAQLELSSAGGTPRHVVFGDDNLVHQPVTAKDVTLVRATQEWFLRESYDILIPVIYRHLYGKTLNAKYSFDFKPLHAPTEVEVASVIEKISKAINEFYQSGMIDKRSANMMLKDIAKNPTDVFNNLSEEWLSSLDGELQTYFSDQIALAKAQQKENVVYSEQISGGMEGQGGDNTKQYGKAKKIKRGQKEK
jgi:uncharacterized protein